MLPLVCQNCSSENESGAHACQHCGSPHLNVAEILRATPTQLSSCHNPLFYPLAWKAYSILVILVNLGTIVFGGLSISNVFGGAISLVLCMPLVGHAWQRALVPSWVGKVAFILGLICIPIVLISSSIRLGALGFFIASAIALLYAPFCRANFLYGYRSNHLWSGVTE